jgi:hypothetical protein
MNLLQLIFTLLQNCSVLNDKQKVSLTPNALAYPTRIAKPCPGVIVLTVPPDIEHPVDGRGAAEAAAAVPVALPVLHGQAGFAVRLAPRTLQKSKTFFTLQLNDLA